MHRRYGTGQHAPLPGVFALVVLASTAIAHAQPSEDQLVAGLKIFKSSGFFPNDLIKAYAAVLERKTEACGRGLGEMAWDNLTSDQQKTLGPSSFWGQTGIGGTIESTRNLVHMFGRGYTDRELALFAVRANLGAALRYRGERCPLTASATAVASSASASSAADVARPASAPRAELAGTPGGRRVVGIDDWEGEIVGQGLPDDKFGQLQIGMAIGAVLARAGQPDGQTFRATNKALIPMYFGADQYRVEYAYKGLGRLLFSSVGGTAGLAITEMHLVRITFDAVETGSL